MEKPQVLMSVQYSSSALADRGKVSGRSDDNPETIKARIQVYENETAPVMDFYKSEGVFTAINGVGSIDDIFAQIVAVLG